jgi:hypothetical protein
LDVLIDSNYQILEEGNEILQNQEIIDKILTVGKILNEIPIDFKEIIAAKMPKELLKICKNFNLEI